MDSNNQKSLGKNYSRGERQKDVADSVKDVLNNNADPHQIAASLHKSYDRLEKNSFSERDAMREVLASNILMAKAVAKLSEEVRILTAKVKTIEFSRL